VTFGNAQRILPFSSLSGPVGVAVDSAGDVFVAENRNNSVVELPKLAAGYGPQITLPFDGLSDPRSVSMDSGGDLFVADTLNNRIVELPKTSLGYGAQVVLPTNGLIDPWAVAVDNAGDAFVADTGNQRVVELPRTGTSYGPQRILISDLNHPNAIAVDSKGNVFFTTYAGLAELPLTGTGYGSPITLLNAVQLGPAYPLGVAADSAGNLFVTIVTNSAGGLVLELPKTSTGYGLPIPFSAIYDATVAVPWGIAVDGAGNVFVTDDYSFNTHPYKVVEIQIHTPVNLDGAYVCTGQTNPTPCSQTLALYYNITASGTLGTPKVLSGGTPNLDFTLAKGSTCRGAVTEGSTCRVNVTFAPTTPGTRNGTVEVTDSGGNVLATTPIYGTGIEPPPVAQVSTTYLDFGTIPVGDSETLPLTVTNTGAGTLTVAPVITGYSTPPPSTFPYDITGNTCGAGVTSGHSCTLQVQFAPTTTGTHDDQLTLKTNGTANPAIGLSGIASASGLGLSGAPLQFGTVPYGSSAVLPLTITNYGLPGTVTVKAVLNSSSFTVLTTAQNTCQAGITSGHSCVLPVQFTPDSVGTHNTLLTLTPSSGGASLTAALHGSGSGLGVNTSVLQFGNIAYGYTETLTITNVGLGSVTVAAAITGDRNYQIVIAQNTCQGALAEGQSCTLPVEFLPTSPGYHYGILTLTPSVGAAATNVGLEGTAVTLTQSVSFAGSPSILEQPATGLDVPNGIAVDNAENVFIAVPGINYGFGSAPTYQAVELPWTALGYGTPTNMPAFPFSGPMAVDSANDVFIADSSYNLVVELPRTKTGYGAQIILPFSGLNSPNGVAVDGAGDVFVSDDGNARVVELPQTKTGYGSQTTVPTGGLHGSIAVDSAGDLFIVAAGRVVELLREGTGYGPPSTLPFTGLQGPNGIAVDSAGDVFVGNGGIQVLELPRVGTGYGTQTVFFDPPQGDTSGLLGVALDSAGHNLFIANWVLLSDSPYNMYGGYVVEVQAHPVNFGSPCASGHTPCSTTLTLYFSANDNTTLGTPRVLTGGAPNLDFTLASGSTCTGAVTAGTFCTLNVTFSPLAPGTRNGTVEIVDGAGAVIATAPIYGVGGEPMAQVSTSTLQFGQIGFGATETLPLTVTNAGQGTLQVVPSIDAPSYTITGNTCGAGVAAGKSCALEVAFSPSAIGTDNGTLTLQNNGPTTPTVALDGIANGLSVGTSQLQFGTVLYGSSAVQPLTVANMGLSGTVTVATKTSDPSYTVLTTAQNTCQGGIAAGQNCTLPVKFTPDSKGDHPGTLTLTASAEGATTLVGLDGAGGAGVSFSGALTTLPFTGLSGPRGIGVDSSGDVFLYDVGNLRVLVLPRTGTGFGPQTTLLAGGLQPFTGSLAGLAVDSAGNVFITDSGNSDGLNDGQVIEIPWTGKGYSEARAFSIYNEEFAADNGNITAQPTGIAVDSLGNIITTDFHNVGVLELPRQGTGYELGYTIGRTTVGGVAVDSAGDVFIADREGHAVAEVPRTSTGYGPQMSLPFSGLPYSVAVDNVGNLFVVVVPGDLLELPSTALGYGPQTTVLTGGSLRAVATDSAGNVYVTNGNSVQELQRNSVNFGSANVCVHGTPAPCSQTLTFNYSVNSNVTFGAPKILTNGKPNLDFTLGTGSTCTGTLTTGSSCTLNVIFTPLAAGTRNGRVEITDSNGDVRASTPVSGLGVSPPSSPAVQVSTTSTPFRLVPFGISETLRLTVSHIGEER
jgi:streptogramin lyase